MTGVSLVAMLVGLGLLILAFVFDHDHDFDHDGHGGPSLFNTKVIGAFLTAFGAIGLVTSWHDVPVGWAITGSTVGGLLLGGLVLFLLSFLHAQQATSHVEAHQIIGRKGVVSITIDAEGLGEIVLSIGGTYLARTHGHALPAGTAVEITGISGDTVIVRPINL